MYNELIELNYILTCNSRITNSLIDSKMFLEKSWNGRFVSPYDQGPEWKGFGPFRELLKMGIQADLWDVDVAKDYEDKLWRSYD